jgi:hypothetical protein
MLLMEASLYFGVPPDFRRGMDIAQIPCFEIASKVQLSVTANTLKIAFKTMNLAPPNRFFGKCNLVNRVHRDRCQLDMLRVSVVRSTSHGDCRAVWDTHSGILD